MGDDQTQTPQPGMPQPAGDAGMPPAVPEKPEVPVEGGNEAPAGEDAPAAPAGDDPAQPTA